MPTPLITRLTHRLFGAPLLRNSIRGEWVEEMVAQALESGWALCADDWGACDLRQVGGTRAHHRPSRRRPPRRRAAPLLVTPGLTRGPPPSRLRVFAPSREPLTALTRRGFALR